MHRIRWAITGRRVILVACSLTWDTSAPPVLLPATTSVCLLRESPLPIPAGQPPWTQTVASVHPTSSNGTTTDPRRANRPHGTRIPADRQRAAHRIVARLPQGRIREPAFTPTTTALPRCTESANGSRAR